MRLLPVSFLLKLLSLVIPLHTSYSLGPTDTADCIAHPDPHITTFDGIRYDYQHGCDVDLIDALDIKIQLRLVKYQPFSPTFSSIKRLAIYFPVSGEKLEINSDGDHFLTSTSMAPNPIITTIGGYSFTKTTSGTISDPLTTYMIDLLPQGHYIQVVDLPPTSEAGGLGISIRGHGSLFYNASGMCGKWNAPAPGLYDRAGFDMLPSLPFVYPNMPLVIDGSAFGDVWQVNPLLEPNHISSMGLPLPPGLYAAFPNTCVARRRLQKQERELQTMSCDYCLGLNNLYQRANCEYDAMVTGVGCSWVEQVPFYKKDDNFWYKKDTCCFRKVPAEVGFTHKNTDVNDPNGFIVVPCEYDTLGCYQKKKCEDSTANDCFKLVECQGADCYIEADCFKQCVRVEEAETGYQLSRTEDSGYFYEKCPHDDTCFEKKTCIGTQQDECYVLKECSAEFSDVCYRDVPCPGPCDDTPTVTPTVTPSAAPSTSPTASPLYVISPTSSPSASPTESPIADPWKCIGCEWMQSIGKVISSGADTCDISMRVTVKGKDGKCLDNDGACVDKPCKYRYQVKYSINQQCVTSESCVLIVSDAYTSGNAPTPPIVTKIKKKKGVVKKKWKKVKCLCKTNTKLFKLQCETATGGISSQSIQFGYTCSECDLMWLPPDEL